jgi:hypothetical protein
MDQPDNRADETLQMLRATPLGQRMAVGGDDRACVDSCGLLAIFDGGRRDIGKNLIEPFPCACARAAPFLAARRHSRTPQNNYAI